MCRACHAAADVYQTMRILRRNLDMRSGSIFSLDTNIFSGDAKLRSDAHVIYIEVLRHTHRPSLAQR